jgi:hypothetical protein
MPAYARELQLKLGVSNLTPVCVDFSCFSTAFLIYLVFGRAAHPPPHVGLDVLASFKGRRRYVTSSATLLNVAMLRAHAKIGNQLPKNWLETAN